MSELLTAREVAERFRITVKSVYRRCEERRMVPPPVLDRPYRFNATHVQQVIDGTWAERQQPQPRTFFAKARRAPRPRVHTPTQEIRS